MKKRIKRIISIILCIALVMSIENMSAYRDILVKMGSNVVTWAASKNENDKNIKKTKNDSKEKDTAADTEEISADMPETTQDEYIAVDREFSPEELASIEARESEQIENEETETESVTQETVKDKKKKNRKSDETVTEAETLTEEAESTSYEPETESESVYEEQNISGNEELAAAPGTSDWIQVSDATEFVNGQTYSIKSMDDWKKLIQVSQTNTFEGVSFVIYKRDATYDNWELNSSSLGTSLTIGNVNYPFSGTIYSFYATTVIYTDRVLFDYLSSKAHIGVKNETGIKTFVVSYSKNVSCALAKNLVLAKEGCTVNIGGNGVSNYYFEISSGTVYANGVVGGLFERMYVEDGAAARDENGDSIYKVNVAGPGIDLIKYDRSGKLHGITNGTITGTTAGGIIGEISGDIDIEISGMTTMPVKVLSTAESMTGTSGGFAGKVSNGVKIKFTNDTQINISTNIMRNSTNTGWCAGGFIGYMENAELECASSGGVLRSGNTDGVRYVGGLVGYAKNSNITVSNYTQKNDTYIYQYATATATANMAVGGVIGMYINDDSAEGRKLQLSYIKSENKNAAKASNIRISGANSQYNKRGGLVGIADAGNAGVSIHDINTDAVDKSAGNGGENCYYVNMVQRENNNATNAANTETGGIAGILAGTDIRLENIKLNYVYVASTTSNAICGQTAGGLVARVGYYNNTSKETKMAVKDITVLSNYVSYVNRDANNYYGGLFGVVSKSIIALQGTIDLSRVPYKTWANSDHYNDTGVDGVMLGGYARRGFVAGYMNQSIIYQDTDCVYTRPITYDADGNIEQFDANIIKYTNPNTRNADTTNLYCIDDIGNQGSIFKNVENVLDITKAYSEVAQGKVDKDADGYYVIDSIGDALRLAVAGCSVNTDGYPQVGGNCFLDDGETAPLTLKDILSRNFRVKTDLNLKEAGIHGFVNNADCRYEFTGIFEGAKSDGKNPVITLDFISRQKYGGLFTNVKNATFRNIDITGNLWYLQATIISGGSMSSAYNAQSAAGSISAYASGDITVDNVNITTSIKTMSSYYSTWDNGQMWVYGGMFGIYNQGTGHYTCTDSKIAPVFTSVITSTFVGGMIGWEYVTKATASENMTVTGCTVSTKLTSNILYGYVNNNWVHGRSGGLIALIAGDYYSVGSTGSSATYPSNIGNETRVKMRLTDTTVDDADIDLSTIAPGVNVMTVGGTLGYSWAYIDADISDLTVLNTDIKSRGVIGGLISTAAGRFNFDNIDIESLNMESVASGDTYCGFLIGNGRNALVNVNVDTYHIAQDGNVSVKKYSSFDEIVGLNLRSNTDDGTDKPYSRGGKIDATYTNGGIVNITDNKFGDFTDSANYKSYTNRVVDIGNKYTRYYYNLFSGNEDDWKVSVDATGTATIDSAKKLMAYTVLKYANTNIARFLTPYTSNIQSASIKSINITSDIDLNTYSYYPVSISNTTCNFNNHTIRFYSEDIYNREKELAENAVGKLDRNNENANAQHYLMHASVFINAGSGVNINNIRLEGTFANLGKESGALVSYSMTGTVNVTGVELAGIRIRGYSNKVPCGLMIARIGTNAYGSNTGSNVTIDGITTTYDYTDTNVTYPVASALIGYVGSESATNVKLTFRNLKLEDEKLADGSKGKVFEYASCVYDYRFTTDLVKNYCYMLYTFTKADTVSGNVTYGNEIKDGVEYLDQARDDELRARIAEAAAGQYIPYVYAQRDIYVNPRNGDLTRGCGTYEDPYIIDNSKQFITLYLYLTNKNQYETMFTGSGKENEEGGKWRVNPVGGDDNDKSACSDTTLSGHHTSVSYGNAGFPTREDLSTAYYKIIADIDLSAFSDLNDKNISGEYCGLGSEDYPFAGVIIGTKGVSGRYTITLPKQGSVNGQQYKQSDFGLIWYMGGAVVKDLEIVGYGYNDTDKAYYNVLEKGGGVASEIIGGDNIIDNVKVSMNFNINNDHKIYGYRSNENAFYDVGIDGIGGLVGTIDTGTLVLRNYQKTDETMINCRFDDFTKKTDNSAAGTYNGNYGELAGILVGKVYDGNVIYEGYDKGTQTKEPYVLKSDNFDVSGGKCTEKFPLVNGVHVVNANIFKNNKLTYSYTDATNKNYQVSIGSSEQLEMLAMAMNSDALSVLYSDIPSYTGDVTGYSYYNRCRKADYNNVGEADAVSSDDRNLAYKYDDNKAAEYAGYLYPYLCSKYIDYTGIAGTTDADPAVNNYNGYKKTLSSVTLEYIASNDNTNTPISETAIVSNTNKMVPQVADYETTYVLQKDADGNAQTFDVSGFDISFRGIGEVYTEMYTGSKANSYLPNIGNASFVGFSDFRANFDGNGNTVKFYINRAFDEDGVWYSGLFNRLTYNQQVIDTNASSEQLEIKNFTIKNSVVYNPNTFKRIESMYNSNGNLLYWNYVYNSYTTYATNTCASGLLAGVMQGAWNVDNVDILKDEEVTYDNIDYDVSGYKSVGGLIGRINNTHYSASDVNATTAWNNTIETLFNNNEAKSNNIMVNNCDINATNNCTFNVTELGSKKVNTYCNAGGNGYYYYNCTFVGGMIGSIGTNTARSLTNNVMLYGNVIINDCDMENVSVTALNKGNIGGIAGSIGTRMCREDINYAANASIGNVTVTGTTGTAIKNVSVNSYNNVAANASEGYSSGGMFGFIESPAYNTHGGQVTITGYTLENINVDTTRTTEMTASSNNQGAGGVIGFSRCKNLNLTDINIKGHNQIGYAGLGKYVGGMIGHIQATGNENWFNVYRSASTINILGCNIEDTDVVGKRALAGGIVGMDRAERLNIGSDTKSNTIKNVKVSNVDSDAAGGVVGGVYYYTGNTLAEQQTVNINNMSVIDTSVSNGTNSAGGVIGRLGQYNTNNVTYAKINMGNVYVYSTASGTSKIEAPSSSGGICGSSTMSYTMFTFTGHIGVGKKYATDAWDTSEDTGINLKAQNSGGLIGNRQMRYAENHTADIVVANNRIYSYWANNTNAEPSTYSGGLYGAIGQYAQGADLVFDKVLVKNNVIFTGRNDLANVNRAWGAVGCGGAFGYVYVDSAASNSGIYLPYLTLENNSIGYYDVSDKSAKQNDWSSVALNSKAVKLYDASNASLKTVSWDEIKDLKDSNIGNYSIAFGQFIGRHSRTLRSSAVYILSPTVTVDKDKVGSIPVIDVGVNAYTGTDDQSGVTYQLGEPYVYRNFVHIVYMDDVSSEYSDISASDTGRKPTSIDSTLLVDGYTKYPFGSFKADVEAYQKLNDGVSDTKEKNYNYIMSKRLNMYMPYNDETTKYSICTGDNSYYNLTYNVKNEDGTDGANILNGVPVLVLDGLDPQTVGDYAAAVLTNGGGMMSPTDIKALNTSNCKGMNDFWKISVENAYIDTDGSIKPITSSDSRFSSHQKTSIQVSDSNRLKLATSIYDEIIKDGSDTLYTITLLKYTYICKGSNGDKTEVIYIPVFVKEKVTLDSYIRILSDEEYSLARAQKEGYKNDVTISHDSVYTIYTEFVYDAIRLKNSFKSDKVNKSIIFDTNGSTVSVMSEGTKFTLIDYYTGISYYYVSTGDELHNEIMFTDFKDKDGNPYQTRNIGDDISGKMASNTYKSIGYKNEDTYYNGNVTYTDVDNKNGIGVERFFIVVEPPENANTAVVQLKMGMYAEDASGNAVDEFFNKNKNGDTSIDVTYVPGPMIQFGGINDDGTGTDGKTYISGIISTDGKVNVDANVEIALKEFGSPYWDEKNVGNTIDSSNNNKYLEVAVTLVDENNNVVAWPAGTNISVNGGANQLLKNNLVVYSYKDMEKQFPMNNVIQNIGDTCYYYNINENDTNPDWQWVYADDDGKYYYFSGFDKISGKWITQELDTVALNPQYIDISNQLHMSFDFSSADIDEYSGNSYKVMLKLYRSDSPDYPNEGNTKAYGSTKRQYTGNVSAESIKELAVAVDPDELTDLGVNLYNGSNKTYEIPFTNRFDFSDLIHKNRIDQTAEECASNDYMVTYRIYKKINADNQDDTTLPIGYNENIGSIRNRFGSTQYKLLDWDESPFTLYDSDGTKLNAKNITVNGDEEQSVIVTSKSFTKDEILNGTSGTKYVTDWNMNLKIDSEKCKNEDLTNYMVTVSYLPYEKGTEMPQTDQAQTLFDYFIFTVAKLKTDM